MYQKEHGGNSEDGKTGICSTKYLLSVETRYVNGFNPHTLYRL
jgi:hypothetical protein